MATKYRLKWLLPIACLLLAGCGGNPLQPVEEGSDDLDAQEAAFQTENPVSREPQEISIVFPAYLEVRVWEEIIEEFNDQNPEYHVTVLGPSLEEDSNLFRAEIMDEITSGSGPDILTGWYVDFYDYAAEGYIQPWGEVFNEQELEDFIPGIMEQGKIKGEIYGIPYEWNLRTLVTSRERLEERESWTLPEMMDCVGNSEASLLTEISTAEQIFDYCILADKDNTDFIDWQNGTCDFSSDAFLDFLQFTREYGSETSSSRGITGENILAGEAFAWGGMISLCSRQTTGSMNFLDAVFGGDSVYIGYSHAQGKGNYIDVTNQQFYLNGASEHQEGALLLLKYLLSEEVQNKVVRYQYDNFWSSYFSVRLSAIDTLISLDRDQEYSKSWAEVGTEGTEYYATYNLSPMTQEQEEQFRRILEQSSFYGEDIHELYLYTYEVFDQFMNGEKTAEETAASLQRCVERYFADMNALKLPGK